jgi:predicted RNA-binding protein with RPS1 domain
MGFFRKFLRLVSGNSSQQTDSPSYRWKSADSSESETSTREKAEEKACSSSDEDPLPQVRTGNVAYVEEKWAIIDTPPARRDGFLPIGEFADEYIDSLKNRLEEGDEVEYVALKQSEENKDRNVVSLSAVEEVQSRRQICEIDQEKRLKVEVDSFKKRYVRVVAENGTPGRIYARDLGYGFIRHGELHRYVNRDEQFEARVKEKVVPSGWRQNDDKRSAHLKLSRKNVLPERDGETFEMPFAATPFRVETTPRLPRRFDPIARFVFEALHGDYSREEIRNASGLPQDSLRQIIELLKELNLIDSADNPTRRGKRMYRAMEWSDQFNEENLEGLFSSTAPIREAFLSTDAINESDLPRGWPNPMWCPQTHEQFMRAGGEDLPGLPFDEIFSDEKIKQVQEAIHNHQLWVYLRPVHDRPKYVRVKCTVSDEWLFATLWFHLESAERDRPFRPNVNEVDGRAKRVRLVELRINAISSQRETQKEEHSDEKIPSDDSRVGDSLDETMPTRLWWEPVSDTFWQLPRKRDPGVRHWHDVDGSAYPELPDQWWSRIQGSSAEMGKPTVTNKRWVSMVSYYGYRD